MYVCTCACVFCVTYLTHIHIYMYSYVCQYVFVSMCMCIMTVFDADSCRALFVEKEIYLKANECSKTKNRKRRRVWQKSSSSNYGKTYNKNNSKQEGSYQMYPIFKYPLLKSYKNQCGTWKNAIINLKHMYIYTHSHTYIHTYHSCPLSHIDLLNKIYPFPPIFCTVGTQL